jgi:epoxyqueuosine reductase
VPPELVGHIGRNYLGDRRYRECPDHDMPRRFSDGLRGLGFRVKRSRMPDRWAGVRAGVTRFGRNCFSYSKEHGSWINVEPWIVDAELPYDNPTPEPPCPEDCRSCLDACPTQALVEPFVMRMDRCVPWLTYSTQEPVAAELWEKMGCWIYGCDVCQDVCPLNRGKWEDREATPWLDSVIEQLTPEALSTMSQETYENIVHPRFWYIPKEDLARWRRNARRALNARAT